MRLPSRPSLARELLWNLALLTGAALSLAVIMALAVQALQPRVAVPALLFLIIADLAIVFVFGRYLIGKLVLRPMRDLMAAADALAAGDLDRRAPGAGTREFDRLAERINGMTEALLDAQSQLVQVEKLAGIGRLAAGVAHEIGNPLAAIGNYLEVARRRDLDPELVAALSREVERIDAIVRGLLSYARPRDEEAGPVDVAAVVSNVIDLLTHQGTLKGRELRVECAGDLPLVRGRGHDLEQVVVNLVLNAADAAASGPIGVGAHRWRYELRWRAAVRCGDEAVPNERRPTGRRPWRPEISGGSTGVLLYVTDAGPGVPEDDREKVFDPFYSTKAPGVGTGLGLAIVQRIVHEMGGVVWVEDAREGGAAFKLFLPEAGRAGGSAAPDEDVGEDR